MTDSLIDRIRDFDNSRPSIPGEHWAALAGGIALWLGTRRHPSLAVRVLSSVAGTLLVVRALSGRDVPPLLQRLPFASGPARGSEFIG